MRLLFILCFVFVSLQCTSAKKPEIKSQRGILQVKSTDPRASMDPGQLALTDLSAAMNMVLQTIDDEEQACKVEEEKIPQLSQGLKMFVDERYAQEKGRYLKKNMKTRIAFFPQHCESDCSCSFYAGFLEYLQEDGIKLKKQEKKILEKLGEGHALENRGQCALKAEWFCTSRLFQEVTKDEEVE
jgi:hypothetical protein